MSDIMHPPGKTTVAPDVLTTIARLTTLGVEGVAHMATAPNSVDFLLKKGIVNEGVRILVDNNMVYADLYIVVLGNYSVREVSHNVQSHVARAFSEMVGMDVGRIDVHVEDVNFIN